jgi:hypothetical protein
MYKFAKVGYHLHLFSYSFPSKNEMFILTHSHLTIPLVSEFWTTTSITWAILSQRVQSTSPYINCDIIILSNKRFPRDFLRKKKIGIVSCLPSRVPYPIHRNLHNVITLTSIVQSGGPRPLNSLGYSPSSYLQISHVHVLIASQQLRSTSMLPNPKLATLQTRIMPMDQNVFCL